MAVLLTGAGSLAEAATCTTALVGVVFGSYDTLTNTSLYGTGSVTVTCDMSTSYSLALSPGHGTLQARQMQSAENILFYNFYTDALRSTIWGDGTGGTSQIGGSGTGASYPIYGLIPGGQRIPAGTYADSVIVTLSF